MPHFITTLVWVFMTWTLNLLKIKESNLNDFFLNFQYPNLTISPKKKKKNAHPTMVNSTTCWKVNEVF